MLAPSIEELSLQVKKDTMYIPLAAPLDMDHSQWFSLYKKLSHHSAYHVILESGRAGRYSYFAYEPTHVLEGKGEGLHISSLDVAGVVLQQELLKGALLSSVKSWMSQRKAVQVGGLPDFKGGLLGFYSYDLVRQIEDIPEQSKDDLHTPELMLLAFEKVVVYDHLEHKHWLMVHQELDTSSEGKKEALPKAYQHAKERLLKWQDELQAVIHSSKLVQEEELAREMTDVDKLSSQSNPISPSLKESEFVTAVQKIQDYISAGDVFQVNLSVRQSRPVHTSPIAIYEELRSINPSPYMGYLHFPGFQIVSASPELLVKVKGREVSTRPIAGTRPRGSTRAEDICLANELIHNEKERAEHVMLVDLERNDLGKVSKYGQVVVDEFMVIEEYSHVMHIVSNVVGVLREEVDAFDVIHATFPGGTITGAPKVRTMEIIEELEPVRRGIYTGSIGWIDFNGDMELNIVIRTIFVKDKIAHIQAGAGIVIDSIPKKEYQESLNKAKALWKAVEQSEQKLNEWRV